MHLICYQLLEYQITESFSPLEFIIEVIIVSCFVEIMQISITVDDSNSRKTHLAETLGFIAYKNILL